MKRFLKQLLSMICAVCMLTSSFGGLGLVAFARKETVVLKQELKASDDKTYEITVTYEIELEEDEEPPEKPELVVRELVEPEPEPPVETDDIAAPEDADAPADDTAAPEDAAPADADDTAAPEDAAPVDDTVPADDTAAPVGADALIGPFHFEDDEPAPADETPALIPGVDYPEEGFDYTYKEYVQKAAEALERRPWELASVRIFDISLRDPVTGEELQPESSVKVNIRLLEETFGEESIVEVVHFAAEENTDAVEPEVMDSAVS